MDYRVVWECDIEAATPEEAARIACGFLADKTSNAHVFDVYATLDGPTGGTLVQSVDLDKKED